MVLIYFSESLICYLESDLSRCCSGVNLEIYIQCSEVTFLSSWYFAISLVLFISLDSLSCSFTLKADVLYFLFYCVVPTTIPMSKAKWYVLVCLSFLEVLAFQWAERYCRCLVISQILWFIFSQVYTCM